MKEIHFEDLQIMACNDLYMTSELNFNMAKKIMLGPMSIVSKFPKIHGSIHTTGSSNQFEQKHINTYSGWL